jgi:hypothetical protein
LRSSHHPPPLVANHFTPKSRGLRGNSGGEGGAIARRRTGSMPELGAPPRIKPKRTTRHCLLSYTATPLYCTAILSPSTPTVSRTALRPPKPHGHEHARPHAMDTRTAVAKPPRPHHRRRCDATTSTGLFLPRKMPRSRSRVVIGHWRTLEATPHHDRSTAATVSTPPRPDPLGASGIPSSRPSWSLEP